MARVTYPVAASRKSVNCISSARPVPTGTKDLSPPIYRWDKRLGGRSPVRDERSPGQVWKSLLFLSSLAGLFWLAFTDPPMNRWANSCRPCGTSTRPLNAGSFCRSATKPTSFANSFTASARPVYLMSCRHILVASRYCSSVPPPPLTKAFGQSQDARSKPALHRHLL